MQERLIQSPRKHYEQPQIIVHGEIGAITTATSNGHGIDNTSKPNRS